MNRQACVCAQSVHPHFQVGIQQAKSTKHMDSKFKKRLQQRLALFLGSKFWAGPVTTVVIALHWVGNRILSCLTYYS